MTGKIFRSTLAASLTVLLASLLVITGCLYTYFGTVREQQLQTELTLAAAAVASDGADYLARVRDTAERLTWVASDGAVLYDTRTDTQPMENHGQREEIREALTGGSGSGARYSETLTEKMLYQAVRLTDGSVLRISGSQKTVWMLVLGDAPRRHRGGAVGGGTFRTLGEPGGPTGGGAAEPAGSGAPAGQQRL